MTPQETEVPLEPEHPMIRYMREIADLRRALARVEEAAAAGGPPYDAETHEAARRLLASAGQITVGQVVSITNRATFHWVLTLTGMVEGRQKVVGDQGTLQLADTDTRASVCDALVAALRAKTEREGGRPFLDAKVLFFDLQPNALQPEEAGRG